MAIVIEQEKQNSGNVVYVLIWIILIIGILVGAYYVFFKNPEIYEKITTSSEKSDINTIIETRSSISLDEVINLSRSLKLYIEIHSATTSGKENPFF